MLKYWYHKWDSSISAAAKLYGNLWIAQSFTPTSSFDCAGATVFLTRTGSPTGNLTLSIYAADGSGNPTGVALATGVIDIATAYGWGFAVFISSPCRVNFVASAPLVADTQYVLVANFSGGTSSNYFIATSLVTGDLAGGNLKHSSNAGGSWTDDANDIIFDLWDATADGSTFVAVNATSNYRRLIEVHRGSLGSTIVKALSVASTATYASFCKTANYLYVGMGTRIYRFSYTLVQDTDWGYIEPGGDIRDIDVAEGQDAMVFSTSTKYGAYTVSTKTLLHSFTYGGVRVNRADEVEDRYFRGVAAGSPGVISAAVKISDNTTIVNQWIAGNSVCAAAIRQATGSVFYTKNTATGLLAIREYPPTSATHIWEIAQVGSATGTATKMIHLPDDGLLIVTRLLNSGVSICAIADDGSSSYEGSVGNHTYDVVEYGDDLLVASASGDDGGGISSIRVVSKEDFSVLWRFDADLLSTVYAVEVLIIDYNLDFTVSGRGELLIEADAELVGEPDPVEDVVIPSDESGIISVWPVAYRPDAPMVEHVLFETTINKSLDQTEERIPLRKCPRIEFEWRIAEGRQSMDNLLYALAMDWMGVPFWHEPVWLTSPMNAGSLTAATTSTAYSQFLAGQWALVISPKGSFDLLKIDTVSANQITFVNAPTHAYKVKAEVLPVSRGIAESISVTKRMRRALYDIKVLVEPIDNDLGLVPYTNGELLLTAVNYVKDLKETFTRPFYRLDGGHGKITQTVIYEHADKGSLVGFATHSRAELWALREMLYKLQGRRIAFQLATFDQEIVPVADLTSGQLTLTIEQCGYTDFIQSRRGELRVVLTNGTVLSRTVVSSVNVSNTVERITVDEAWASTIVPAEIDRIEYLDLVRFDTDDIVIEHRNAIGYAKCEVPVAFVEE